jgi:hypothetical protein
METKANQITNAGPTSAEGAFSGEWYTRYLLNAALLVVLLLAAIGIALYLDASETLRDWNKEPGAGFLACLLLCPMLAMMTLVLALQAGIRLFRRPRTLGHASVRLALLVAHVSVFLVCAETVSSTATALVSGPNQSSAGLDPTEAWRAVDNRDYAGSSSGAREGPPAGMSSPPSFGPRLPGSATPGGGTSSR